MADYTVVPVADVRIGQLKKWGWIRIISRFASCASASVSRTSP